MSMNLNLQNWPPPAPLSPSLSAPQMMNRSAIGLNNANAEEDANELWNRSFKLAKLSQPVFSSTEENQMLSFSGSGIYNNLASHYNPNFTGHYGCGGANMHDIFNGPFTPSQWVELEHQALIYKHITSNMHVPSSLLMPIRRALSNAAFSRYNAGHLTSMGWGGFHLGMQNNNDPEPGRCRRTDGKKWRCSRDAVVDQKYCERHINRGRHRSRKPVEGLSRYSDGNVNSSHLKAIPIPMTVERKFSLDEKHLQLGTSVSAQASRISMNKEMTCSETIQVDSHKLSIQPSIMTLNPLESLYNIHNKKQSSYGELLGSDFGLVSSNALKNPSDGSIHTKSYKDKNISDKQIMLNSAPTHQFIDLDDFPKDQPDCTSAMWPNLDDTKLSVSVPEAYHVKDSSSSLTLAWEFGGNKQADQHIECEDSHRPNWIIGGPLGEALHNGSKTNSADTKTPSKLNLMTHG